MKYEYCGKMIDGTDDRVQPHIGMLVCDDIDYEYNEDGDVKSVYLFMKKICIALFVKGYGLTGFTFEGDEYALPKQKDE